MFCNMRQIIVSGLGETKKVTADLLVVTVMIVSLLAGQPLSGALVAWFINGPYHFLGYIEKHGVKLKP